MSGLRIAAGLGVGTILAALVVSSGLARQALAADNGAISAALWGARGEATELGAQIALERGETARAEALARQALHQSPGHVAALRVLAQAGQAHGDEAAALRFMALAGRWSWRDTPVQGALFDAAVARRDFTRAMDHADAILRMREIESEMFGVLRYAGEDPDFRHALIAKLATGPDWRGSFFRDAVRAGADQRAGLEATIRDMRATRSPVTPYELSGYATSLVGSGETPRAAALWTSQFGGDPDQGLSLAWPGEVRSRRKLPFDWWIAPARGVMAVPAKADGAPLEIVADRGAHGLIAARLFALPPGRYRLGFAGTQPDPAVRRALRWTMRCSGSTIAADSADEGWRITLPQGCTVQTLRLEIDNPDIRFEALLGSIRLQRVGGETTAMTG